MKAGRDPWQDQLERVANFARRLAPLERTGGPDQDPTRRPQSRIEFSTVTAIAASLAAAGIGTETDGSIICPAAVAGLVGLKPTVGLVSRSGIIPISHSQDTAGPMARTVSDAALLLAAIVGRDDADVATTQSSGRTVFDYAARLKTDGLRGARIGVVRKSTGYQPMSMRVERAIAGSRPRARWCRGGHTTAVNGTRRNRVCCTNQGRSESIEKAMRRSDLAG